MTVARFAVSFDPELAAAVRKAAGSEVLGRAETLLLSVQGGKQPKLIAC